VSNTPADSPGPITAMLLLSFGGPDGPDDVLPFLRRVTAGRGVPDDRLTEVAEHYHQFGGKSPINDQNRALLAALRAELAGRSGAAAGLPVYWGNRNWHPLLVDTLRAIAADGHREVAVFVTSAYSSYSGCRQYRENLADAVAEAGLDGVLRLYRLPHYHARPGFVAPFADGLRAALVAAAAGVHQPATGEPGWSLVYCSRSGPPSVPWLEPDINPHLRRLAGTGVPGVAVVPIGFVSDHMEVRYDLDTEAAATAADCGLAYARVATPGTDPRFVATVADMLVDTLAAPAAYDCPAGCCANLRGPRPTLCGSG
jgi:ferrochelatase